MPRRKSDRPKKTRGANGQAGGVRVTTQPGHDVFHLSPCAKVRYPSMEAGEAAIQEHDDVEARQRLRVYWCPRCFGYHFTSK